MSAAELLLWQRAYCATLQALAGLTRPTPDAYDAVASWALIRKRASLEAHAAVVEYRKVAQGAGL